VFEITVVDGGDCQEEGRLVVPHRGKHVDYVTLVIPKSYLVILKRYWWRKIDDEIRHTQ